jgi:hypothetical protein
MVRSDSPPKGRLVVFGIMFWMPMAGVIYQFLHYLIGLRRLGYEVFYVEERTWPFDVWNHDYSADVSRNVAYVAPILEAHGFKDHWAYRGDYPVSQPYGMSDSQLVDLYRTADALLNVTGSQELRDEHMACPRRLYIESDPVACQVMVAEGVDATIQALARHDMHFTFGENIGSPDCGVPVKIFDWQPTRQPVLLDWWAGSAVPSTNTYTTIASWKNHGKDIWFQGETYYWSKDREFMKVIELPSRSGATIELAMRVEEDVAGMLAGHGWRCVDSFAVSSNLESYRNYIQSSKGEFTVAKDQNIRLRSGWFSDRSACYLAAGRPVITQETGFDKILPVGKGLFSFQTLEDAVAALDAVESNYAAQSAAAREIAAEYFDASKVLGGLLRRAGL